MQSELIGKIIDVYKITQVLGQGGMGVVCKAHDLTLGRDVAMKMIDSRLALNDEAMQRFRSEAQVLAKLKNAHIVTIYSLCEAESGIFIVMEYVEGKTIHDVIRQTGPMSLERVVSFSTQLLEALDHAHRVGVIHRDIKPSNILVGEGDYVKVTDFGLAKFKGAMSLTRTGTTLGTPGYMSPEQIQGDDVDHRTDVWSVGVVIFEMLSGMLPFRGDHEAALSYSIVNEDPIPLRTIRPELPHSVESTIARCLEKQRNKRFSTALELQNELEGWVSGNSGMSTRTLRVGTTRTVRPGRPALLKRPWVLGMSLAAVSLVLMLWLMKVIGSTNGSPMPLPNVEDSTDDRNSGLVQETAITQNSRFVPLEAHRPPANPRVPLFEKETPSDVEVVVHLLEMDLDSLQARSSVQDAVKWELAQYGYSVVAEVAIYDVVSKRKLNEAVRAGDYTVVIRPLAKIADLIVIGLVATERRSNPREGIFFCSGRSDIQLVEARAAQIIGVVSSGIEEVAGETYNVASDRLIRQFTPTVATALKDTINLVLGFESRKQPQFDEEQIQKAKGS